MVLLVSNPSCYRWRFLRDIANLFDTVLVLGGLVDTNFGKDWHVKATVVGHPYRGWGIKGELRAFGTGS